MNDNDDWEEHLCAAIVIGGLVALGFALVEFAKMVSL